MNANSVRRLALALLYVTAWPALAGECISEAERSDAQSCLTDFLQTTDRNLNERYGELMNRSQPEARRELKTAQKAWLIRRNELCQLDRALLTRRDWMKTLAREFSKANCVIDLSRQRADELAALLAQLGTQANPNLDSFPLVKTSWSATFARDEKIPPGQFQAYYFNTRDPKTVIASERVSDIAINYSWDQFHGINSEEFGAYWVGEIELAEDSDRLMNIHLSWSDAEVLIDKHRVHAGGKAGSFPLHLAKGRHLIEVQYQNHWHTTDFRVQFAPPEKLYSAMELKQRLASAPFRSAALYYAGVYESGNRDQGIDLDLAEINQPAVLFLSSYDPVRWRLTLPRDAGQLKALLLGASNPGSDIVLPEGVDVPILRLAQYYGSYTLKPACTCIGATWHCEHRNGDRVIQEIESLTGMNVTGIIAEYSAKRLNLPGLRVNGQSRRLLDEQAQALELKRQQCQDLRKPNNAVDKTLTAG